MAHACPVTRAGGRKHTVDGERSSNNSVRGRCEKRLRAVQIWRPYSGIAGHDPSTIDHDARPSAAWCRVEVQTSPFLRVPRGLSIGTCPCFISGSRKYLTWRHSCGTVEIALELPLRSMRVDSWASRGSGTETFLSTDLGLRSGFEIDRRELEALDTWWTATRIHEGEIRDDRPNA
jgi:hypothetical protein